MGVACLEYDYLLKIYKKTIVNDRMYSIDIILTDIYDLETFELWYMNNARQILKLQSADGLTHYIDRDEISHVASKKVFFDGEKYV
jgi:hypothetical protein